MTIGNNIREARELKGFTRRDVAIHIGENVKKIEHIEYGSQRVQADLIPRLSQYLEVSIDYLITGKEPTSAIASTSNDTVAVPFYGNVPVSAGGGAVVLDEEPTEMIEIPRSLAKRILSTEKPMTFPVMGDSMEPNFKNGDTIIAGVGDIYICDGVYVVRYDGIMLIKRLMKAKNGYLLISDNTLYKDITVTKTDDFLIIGRVIQVLHNV